MAFMLLPLAAQALEIRASEKENFSRVVFEFPQRTDYDASQQGNIFRITFKTPAPATTIPSISALTRVEKIAQSNDTVFEITVKSGMSARAAALGNRVIVDIKGGPSTQTSAPTPTPEASIPSDAPDVLTPPIEPVKKATEPVMPAVAPPVVETLKTTIAAEKPTGAASPHTITLGSSSALSMAVFKRDDRLWLVTNQPNMVVFPQVEGRQAEDFPPFDKIAIQGGTAYRVQLPANLRTAGVVVESEGLVWKIFIATPEKQKAIDIWPLRTIEANAADNKLSWKLPQAQDRLQIEDPQYHDQIIVVPVTGTGFAAVPQSFLQFELLESYTGLAFVPEIETFLVTKEADQVVVRSPDGLMFSPASDVSGYIAEIKKLQAAKAEPAPAATKEGEVAAPVVSAKEAGLIRFEDWRQAGLEELKRQSVSVLSGLAAKTPAGQAEDLIALTKSSLAHGQSAEAKGFIDYAVLVLPGLADTAEVRALRGVALLQLGQADLAYRELSASSLDNIPEMAYWRSIALAMLEDWQQAGTFLPQETAIPTNWPDEIKYRFIPFMAETALRKGDIALGERLMAILTNEATLPPYVKMHVDYLKGESARQRGDNERAEQLWEELSKSTDDLYRARAGLALVSLQYSQKKIDQAEAIDKLERLRYAWRGDALEMTVNFRLGQVYMEAKDYLKGFSVLRNAASLTPEAELSGDITAFMVESFKKIFQPETLKETDPLLALTVYEEFGELLPPGEEGKAITQALAERLREADMLEQSAKLLGKQVKNSSGLEAVTAATQLAAVRLIDRNPEAALKALEGVEEPLSKASTEDAEPKRREIALLRARAHSQLKQPDEAFKVLNTIPQEGDALRLRADIAWQSQRWQDAAEALERLVQAERISVTRPMTDAQANLVLNWAVALNLADNRYVLANVRERFALAMQSTKNAKLFDVVTRARQNAGLADRETIRSFTSEVDMFKDFLESYKK
ncbi:MAG: hypothetical protein GC136_07055 [Alphaproteobacteria bacterium]|nr:hypothetical protein [Alphaproteobacteria bacterium]